MALYSTGGSYIGFSYPANKRCSPQPSNASKSTLTPQPLILSPTVATASLSTLADKSLVEPTLTETPSLSENAVYEKVFASLQTRQGDDSLIEFPAHPMTIPDVSEEIYDLVKARTNKLDEKIPYYYDFSSRSIIVTSYPSRVHESVHTYLGCHLLLMLQSWLRDTIPDADINAGGSIDQDFYGPNGQRVKGKVPDESYDVGLPGMPEDSNYPKVAVEVGYSEDESTLHEDTVRWLWHMNNEVRSVIVIKFKKPSKQLDFSDTSKWKATLEVLER